MYAPTRISQKAVYQRDESRLPGLWRSSDFEHEWPPGLATEDLGQIACVCFMFSS
jgi:hypothetical protein